MLNQRLRRWPNIVQMLYKCFVFGKMVPDPNLDNMYTQVPYYYTALQI